MDELLEAGLDRKFTLPVVVPDKLNFEVWLLFVVFAVLVVVLLTNDFLIQAPATPFLSVILIVPVEFFL